MGRRRPKLSIAATNMAEHLCEMEVTVRGHVRTIFVALSDGWQEEDRHTIVESCSRLNEQVALSASGIRCEFVEIEGGEFLIDAIRRACELGPERVFDDPRFRARQRELRKLRLVYATGKTGKTSKKKASARWDRAEARVESEAIA